MNRKCNRRPLKGAPVGEPAVRLDRSISAQLRSWVLDRDDFTCQMCGLSRGETDPSTGRKVRLHIGHIEHVDLGGTNELSNLRALCTTCNRGAKEIKTERPSAIWLLSQIRRARLDTQRVVFVRLLKKFWRDALNGGPY